MFIDTHAHLDCKDYDADREAVIQRAKDVGVEAIVTIGIDVETSQRAIAIAEKHESIYAAVGFHPHDAKLFTPGLLDKIRELVRHPKVVAIGEIGLDYYRHLSPVEKQKEVCAMLLELAKEENLPVILHDREAHDDLVAMVRAHHDGKLSGVFHCFSGDLNMAARVLEMGFLVSFTGNITFKNSQVTSVAKEVPLDKLMIETDCPFMGAPVPYRGQRNEPAYVIHVAKKLAELKNVRVEEVAQVTTENAKRLFGL